MPLTREFKETLQARHRADRKSLAASGFRDVDHHSCAHPLDCRVSREVDVVAETTFTCPLEQSQQRRSFRSSSLPSDDDDDAAMMLRFRELDEVVAIAGHHKAIMLVSKLQDCGIRCLQRQHIAEPEDFVVQFSKQVGEIFGTS